MTDEQRPEEEQSRDELGDEEKQRPPNELAPATRPVIERPRHTLPVEPVDPR